MSLLYVLPIFTQILPSFTYYETSKLITTLNPSSLRELREDQSDDLWCVQFYNGSDSRMSEISEIYERAARSIEGHAKMGAIDLEEFPLVKYVMVIENHPTYLYYGYYKYMPSPFQLNSLNEIREQTTKELNHLFNEKGFRRFIGPKVNYELGVNGLKQKVEGSENPWAVVFYDANCQICKDFAKVWEKLVLEFKEVIQFGSINDVGKVLVNETRYPVVKYFSSNVPVTYEGAMEYEQLHNFLNNAIDDPKIWHVVNYKSVEKCLRKLYCIFSFLPTNRADTLNNLTTISITHKQKSWVWFWNDFGEQGDIEEAFVVEKSENPILVALNVHDSTYMKLELETEAKLEKFVNNIIEGVDFKEIATTKVPDIKIIKHGNLKHEEL